MASRSPDSFQADFGRTSADYAKHRAGFPESFYERLEAFGIGMAGQRLLDLGTGTGTVARRLARAGAEVVGLDISENQMAAAKALDRQEGVAIEYVLGKAEATGLAAASFDAVVAGQCWHWFDSVAAMAEMARLLRPTGRLVIAHFDWLPIPGNMVEATEQLILKYNPAWPFGGRTGIYPQWAADAGRAGYREVEIFAYDHVQRYSHEDWRGRIRASAGVGGSLPGEAVVRFDADLAAILRERFPHQPMDVLHRVFALIARPPVLVRG